MKAVVLETYPDMFTDYEEGIENEEYDNQSRWITVPMGWAAGWVYIQYRMGLDEFLGEYTMDDTYKMYEDAKADGVLLNEKITDRDSQVEDGIVDV